MEDDDLGPRRLVDDGDRAAGLGAGAGGGGNGDHRGDGAVPRPRPVVGDIIEIPDRPVLVDHQRDGLSGIHGAAAAEGDDAVVAAP